MECLRWANSSGAIGLIPRTLENCVKAKFSETPSTLSGEWDAGGQCLGFDSAKPLARAEFTSRTEETRRNPSIRESRSSSLLHLPRTR